MWITNFRNPSANNIATLLIISDGSMNYKASRKLDRCLGVISVRENFLLDKHKKALYDVCMITHMRIYEHR